MKIQIASDLHTEFHRDNGKTLIKNLKTDSDVLVLPGDLATHLNLSNFLTMLVGEYPNVVFVLGNHEFYNSGYDEVMDICSELTARHKNLHFLNNSFVVIDGQRFIGGTLWFPDGPNNILFAPQFNDFSLIKDFANWVYKENSKTVKHLNTNVLPSDIVVTHYLPSTGSIAAQYKTSQVNIFFMCDMEKLILEKQPKLWAHGHTHSSCDYTIDATRVVCNPFGYVGHETNNNFNEQLVIEV